MTEQPSKKASLYLLLFFALFAVLIVLFGTKDTNQQLTGTMEFEGQFLASTSVELPFTDMTNHFSTQYVQKLYALGLVKGKTDTTYNPDGLLNRAEAVTLLVRAMQNSKKEVEKFFTDFNPDYNYVYYPDVAVQTWYAAYVGVAADKELVSRVERTFRPEDPITRAEFLKMALIAGDIDVGRLSEAYLLQGEDYFEDVEPTLWYAPYVYSAAQLGIIDRDQYFYPTRSLTRGEAAKVLYLTLKDSIEEQLHSAAPEPQRKSYTRENLSSTGALFRGTVGRSGVVQTTPVDEPEVLLWEFKTANQLSATPVIFGDRMYIGSRDGFLNAIDKNSGEVLWRFDTRGKIISAPSVAGGILYIGAGTVLFAIDAETGEELWTHIARGTITTSPLIIDAKVYYGDSSEFAAIDALTGSVLWNVRETSVYSSPSYYKGMLYFGGWDGKLYAVDAKTGVVRWTYSTGGQIVSTPAVDDELVVFGSYDQSIYAIDHKKGQLAWSYETEGVIYASPLLMSDMVVVGSTDGFVYALDKKKGTTLWQKKTGGEINSSPILVGDTIYVGSDDTHIYALNRYNGSSLWRFKMKDKVFASPVIDTGILYVGSFDGTLYALTTREVWQTFQKEEEQETTGDATEGENTQVTTKVENTDAEDSTTEETTNNEAIVVEESLENIVLIQMDQKALLTVQSLEAVRDIQDNDLNLPIESSKKLVRVTIKLVGDSDTPFQFTPSNIALETLDGGIVGVSSKIKTTYVSPSITSETIPKGQHHAGALYFEVPLTETSETMTLRVQSFDLTVQDVEIPLFLL